jgi:hypothetical protein
VVQHPVVHNDGFWGHRLSVTGRESGSDME